jgi:hypothetical protein
MVLDLYALQKVVQVADYTGKEASGTHASID